MDDALLDHGLRLRASLAEKQVEAEHSFPAFEYFAAVEAALEEVLELPALVAEAEGAQLHLVLQLEVHSLSEPEPATYAVIHQHCLDLQPVLEVPAPQLHNHRSLFRQVVRQVKMRNTTRTVHLPAYLLPQPLVLPQLSLADLAGPFLHLPPTAPPAHRAKLWPASPAEEPLRLAAEVEWGELRVGRVTI